MIEKIKKAKKELDNLFGKLRCDRIINEILDNPIIFYDMMNKEKIEDLKREINDLKIENCYLESDRLYLENKVMDLEDEVSFLKDELRKYMQATIPYVDISKEEIDAFFRK